MPYPRKRSKSQQFKNPIQTLSKLKFTAVELLPLLVVLLFALLLRLILFTGVLDYDVLDYAYLAYDASFGNIHAAPDLTGVVFRYALYLPVGLAYALFGPSENATILYPFLVSMLGVAGIYGIGRLQANESAGILAALIWAAFPLNVFLSTLFGPDSLLSNFTIAAVFFLLWANKLKGRQALWRFGTAGLFALFAILIKPSAVILLVFFAAFAVHKFWQAYQKRILQQISEISLTSKKVWLTGIFLFLFSLGIIYIQSQPRPFIERIFSTATDLSSLVVLGQTQESFPVVGDYLFTNLFLVAGPLFIISFAGVISIKQKGGFLPILWAASCFLFFEWGSRSLNPFQYSPFLAATNDRNILFIFAPFAVIVGIYYSRAIAKTNAFTLAFLALLIVPLVGWVLEMNGYEGLPRSLLAIAVAMSIIGSVLLPLFIRGINKRINQILAGAFFLITLLAFLYPTPPLHISETFWQRQINYRQTLIQAGCFLVEHPEYPVFTLSRDNAQELNFVSNFKLGHRLHLISEELPDARIEVISDPLNLDRSGFVFLRDEINQFSPVPSNWWKVAQFDLETDKPIVIFRVLTPEDAARELSAAIAANREDSSRENLDALLGAAINSADINIAVDTWSHLNQFDPQAYSIHLIAPLILDRFNQDQSAHSLNFLDPELGNYRIDGPLEGRVRLEAEGEEAIITADIPNDLQGHYGVYSEVTLKPESVYVFLLDIKSTTGVDVLRVADGEVLDSHDYSGVYGEWSEVIVIFVTPAWEGDENVRLDLFTVNKKGTLSVKNPALFLLETGQP